MNIQKKLLRIRPPRVKITYEVDSEYGLHKKELPFVIGVIADLYGAKKDRVDYRNRKFIELNQDNFGAVMESIAPELTLSVKNMLNENSNKLRMNLKFSSLECFKPDSIIKNKEFADLLQDRRYLIDLVSKADSDHDLTDELMSIARDQAELTPELAVRLSKEFFGSEERRDTFMAFKRLQGSEIRDLHGGIMRAIADMDRAISLQTDEILHHQDFQALEASWRGLHELVYRSELSEQLRIKVLNCSIDELRRDSDSSDFDQSHLFKLIYEEEYGTMGGIPFSCLIGDIYFDKSEQDVELIKFLASVAAASHAPLLVGTKPSMFDLKSFMDLHLPRDLKKIFENSDAVLWNSFRDMDESRYVSLFLPYVLMRMPYGPANPVRAFNYIESVDGERNDNFCWGNPAYFMGIKISEAIVKYGWAAAIRGPEGGGLVRELPAYTFKTSFGDIAMKCPTQTHITDRREKELSDLGFIALCHKKMTNEAVFFSGQTAQQPRRYRSEDADASANLSSKMPYMLNASRFAHYIKVIMRDKVGSFQSPKNVKSYLQSWIAEYVLLSDEADQDIKAEYPLREAQILVEDSPIPGEYTVILNMRPHFQMEGLRVSLRFVAKILSEME